MQLTFEEISGREVINLPEGECFGLADDLIIETETGEVKAIVIKGKPRFFGIFGREEEKILRWEEIEFFGRDAILARSPGEKTERNEKMNIFQKFFNIFL